MSPFDKNISNVSIPYQEDYVQLVSYLENTESSLKKVLKIPSARRVHFCEEVIIYSSEFEFSEVDKDAVWYSNEDFEIIKVGVKSDLKRMKAYESEDESCCYRGLEARTKAGSRTRQRNREGVFYAVFMEQHLQLENSGDINPEALSSASMQASLPARATARHWAERDEKCAIALYLDWARIELEKMK